MKKPLSILRLSTYITIPVSVALLCGLLIMSGCHHGRVNEDCYIRQLDSVLERAREFEQHKLMELDQLRHNRARAATDEERYMANAMLFDGYSTFNVDSAMKYVDENLRIAAAMGSREREFKCKIDKSELLAATGLLSQSMDLMRSIDRQTLPPEMLVNYYGQMIFLYSHMGNFAGGSANEYYVHERAYKDSIMGVIQPGHPEYLWYKGWDVLGTNRSSAPVIEELRAYVDASPLDSRQDAKNAYILASLYMDKGDEENYSKYMAMSAIADVKIANAEIASLEDMAKFMFSRGDIDKAYTYINYSLDKAMSYPNRVKAYSITQTMDKVYTELHHKNVRQQERMRFYLVLASILAVVLAVSVVIIITQMLKLSHHRHALDRANKTLSENNRELSEAQAQVSVANMQLKKLNADLQSKNQELAEANYVKEEYIGYVFSICSSYISKLETLKNRIHNKMLARQYKDIERETESFDIKEELKDFYHSFDTIFLHIYPNFVSDFNTLLQDDKKIYPKEGELLNMELRIYALVRLGITDSVKIADFLHCSPQTVYNNRFKVRNKARISRKDFADTVRTLGTYEVN